MSFFWMAWAVVPLLVVFGKRDRVAGWDLDQALVVMGWFLAMKGVLEGAVNPSLASVVEHIRKGTLDLVLLKPVDAQFLVSTAKFAPWHVVDVAAGAGVVAWAFSRLGRWPGRGRRGGGAAPHPLRRGRPLLAVDPGGVGRLLRGEGGQPLLPVPLHLRRGPLAGLGLHRLLALPLHRGHPAGPHDHLPGRGAARAHPARRRCCWRWPGRSPSWPPHGWFGCGPSRGIPRPRPDRPPCSASPSSAPRVPCPRPPATCRGSRCATGGSTTSSTAARARSAR